MKTSMHFSEMIGNFSLIFILVSVCRIASLSTVQPEADTTEYSLFPANNKWYKLHTDVQNWVAAEQTCVQEGGHLTMPTTLEEANYLKQLMLDGLPGQHTPALLGFSKGAHGKFITVYGLTLEEQNFPKWSSNSLPGIFGLKGGNCGSLHMDGGLSRISCHLAAPFICERDNNTPIDTTTTPVETTTTPIPTTTTTIPPQPAPGYEYLTDLGWYKIYPKKTWHEALKVCEEENTHLAILNSNKEAQSLARLMSRNNRINFGICGCAFIGFHDLSTEGHFTTVFGQPLESTGYLKWNKNNPDNTGNNEDCGSITYQGLLNDLSCVEKYPFICEFSNDTALYNPDVNQNVSQPTGGYQTFEGVGRYKLHTAGIRWYEALDVCDREGAYLAIVNSDKESDVLRKIIGRNPDLDLGKENAIFLGFHDIPSKEDFTTIFGDPLNTTGFTTWASKVSTNFDCGALNRNGRLTLLNCFSKVPFICEKLSETERQKTPAPPREDSSENYTFYDGFSYYKLHVQKATWYLAKKKCEQELAHLAIINSEEESNLLKDIASRNPLIKPHSSILLGYHDISTEGRFVTIYGTPIESSGFSKWREFNPDNFGGGEDCGAMDHNGLLNDVPCDLKLEFFCERDLTSSPNISAYNARRMRITPEHMHVRQGGHVSIICEAPEPLIECHFKIFPLPIMDLSRGSASKTNASLLGSSGITNYRYNGTGLENGQCGIVLYLYEGLHRTTVGCRGRAIRGGWYYAYMSLHASNAAAVRDVKASAKEIMAFAGQPVKIVWKASSPVTQCKCIFPFIGTEVFLVDPNSAEQEEDYYDESEEAQVIMSSDLALGPTDSLFHGVQYFGRGYRKGDCGINFVARSSWGGFLWCGIGTESAFEWRSISINIVKPPSTPQLILNAIEHSEGAILEAECRASGSVPMPNITWYLGDDIIRQDTIDDSPSATWSWPYSEQIITQKLTRQVKLEDQGKELICEASNPLSPDEPVRTKKTIFVGGSVLNRTFDVEEYGFEVGQPGFIVITITASPKPNVTWHFDNVTIQGGKQDISGRFTSTLASKGSLNIQWVAKLYISNVTDEDFARDFHLTAKNEFGAQAYKVVIVRGRTTTEAPTTTTTTAPSTRRTTTTRIFTRTTSNYWTTAGLWETTTPVAPAFDSTQGYSQLNEVYTEATPFEGVSVTSESTSGWGTGGAIFGIVLIVLLLSAAAVVVYGRRAGWSFIPPQARRHFGPAMSMDNLMDEEDALH